MITKKKKEFIIYKGLQMPLVFKGFKGKYIYWGLASFIGSFLACAISTIIFSISVGIFLMVAGIVFGFFMISQKQKKGLYSKNNEKGIFVIKNTFNKI